MRIKTINLTDGQLPDNLGAVGFCGDVNVTQLRIAGADPEQSYKLDLQHETGVENVLDLENDEGTLSVTFDSSVLIPSGRYRAQLRTVGSVVWHSNQAWLTIYASINAEDFIDQIPTEMHQIEERVTAKKVEAETAQAAAEAAETAAENAQGKAEDAQTAAETAQGKAEDAQAAAEAAAETAAAEAAAAAVADAELLLSGYVTDAQTAKNAAETAQGKAEDAQKAAETAQGKAEDAQTAAETAQGKAEDAQTSAETAQGKAEDAQEAAETAQGKAEDAQEAAETAQGKAEDAQQAAETAQGKAEDAQEAAETAQGKAEDAQEAAEDAAETATQAATAAVETALETVVAPEYSAQATYSKGDFVLYNGAVYRAKRDIETAEAWTAAHWESVSVGEALQQLQTAVSAPETYKQLQALVRSGLAHLSVKAGDQIVGKVDGRDRDFDVLGVDEDCPVDTPTKHVLSLQMHDIWTALSYLYDFPQYLYVVTDEKFPSGMGPGIYTFKLDHAVNKTAYATAEDGYYSFVIPQGYSVPVGGGIRHTIMGSEASGNAYSPSRILGGKFICYGADRVTAVSGLNALSTVAPLTFAEGSALRGQLNAETFYGRVGTSGGQLTFRYVVDPQDAANGWWVDASTTLEADLQDYGITFTGEGQPADQEEIVVTLGKMLGTTTAKFPVYLSSNEPINYTSRQFYGSNRWKTSFARQFLNSDASPMVFDYTQAGAFGRPPAIMPNAGFLSQLDPDLKSVLCKITKRYASSVADGGGYEDVDDKVTLCTLLDYDLGANNGIYEGAVDENGQLERQSAHALWKDSQQADRIKYYNGTARGWYLSSCRPEGAGSMNVFVNSGGMGDAQANGAYGLVPCIFIG